MAACIERVSHSNPFPLTQALLLWPYQQVDTGFSAAGHSPLCRSHDSSEITFFVDGLFPKWISSFEVFNVYCPLKFFFKKQKLFFTFFTVTTLHNLWFCAEVQMLSHIFRYYIIYSSVECLFFYCNYSESLTMKFCPVFFFNLEMQANSLWCLHSVFSSLKTLDNFQNL